MLWLLVLASVCGCEWYLYELFGLARACPLYAYSCVSTCLRMRASRLSPRCCRTAHLNRESAVSSPLYGR